MHKANLNLLPTLKVLLETRNISRAAELLNLSQPSISKQLGQLRSEFGDELLVREGQRWLLTPRAEALAAQLADSLGALERLYEAPEFAPERCERVFRLASSDYVAQHILPDICAALALSLDQILIPCAIRSLAARKPSSLLCRASQPSQRAPQLAIPVRLLSIKPPSLAIAM